MKRSGTTRCCDENIIMSGYQIKQQNSPTESTSSVKGNESPKQRRKLYEVEAIICPKICL